MAKSLAGLNLTTKLALRIKTYFEKNFEPDQRIRKMVPK